MLLTVVGTDVVRGFNSRSRVGDEYQGTLIENQTYVALGRLTLDSGMADLKEGNFDLLLSSTKCLTFRTARSELV